MKGIPKSAQTERYGQYLRSKAPTRYSPKQRAQRAKYDLPQRQLNQQNKLLAQQNLREQNRFGPRARAPPKGARLTQNMFSDCSLYYAQALIDPWSVERAPCVPDALTLPSWKFGARTRGNFLTGTASTGYIVANPYQQCGDRISVYYTNNASTFTNPGYGGPTTDTGTFGSSNDSPITSAAWPANNDSYRPVGAGLAVRYVGNEMARGGQMILYRDPQNQYIIASSVAGLLSNKESTTVPVDREWHYVVWKPADFQDTSYTSALQASNTGQLCLLIYINGSAPGSSYEFDFVQWFEVIGRDIPNLTPSENDPVGMAVIKSAIALPQPPDSPTSNFRDFLRNATAIANDTLSFMGAGAKIAMKGGAILSNIGLL